MSACRPEWGGGDLLGALLRNDAVANGMDSSGDVAVLNWETVCLVDSVLMEGYFPDCGISSVV